MTQEQKIQRHNERMMRIAQNHWPTLSAATLFYAMKFGMINIVPPPERKKRKP